MLFNKEILFCVLILLFIQIIIWFQLNGQVKWDWFKDNYFLMSLLGIPISILFWYCTKWGYVGFGNLWSVRFMGFATSMISFPIMTWLYLGETISLKTFLSLGLAVIIMLLQLL